MFHCKSLGLDVQLPPHHALIVVQERLRQHRSGCSIGIRDRFVSWRRSRLQQRSCFLRRFGEVSQLFGVKLTANFEFLLIWATTQTTEEALFDHLVHVSIRIVEECESLRRRAAYHVVREAIADACEQFSTRIVHFSVMSNHVHLICETLDSKALSRAVKGLCVRLARRLNRLWQRSGAVIEARYHARALKTPREVKNAIAYLLQNARRHGLPYAGPDPCSSGVWFDGWERILNDDPLRTKSPLPLPRTWLLSVGWRRHGPIPLVPGTPSPR